MLDGVNVALGVSGSIAAVKTVELTHELRRRGATVRAMTTDAACSIVHPWSLQYATGHEVVTELTGAVEHVELCGSDGWADVLLLAPATANTVGKVASAIDDTPVTTCATTALGAGIPVVIAPAMHEPMYDHPGVLNAIEALEDWGVSFVAPRVEEGKAKIATEDAIAAETARAAGSSPLDGRSVVVTAGPTSEAIDPVRVLSNRSSGHTGRAVARACYARGADVAVIHGRLNGGVPDLPFADVDLVDGAEEMLEVTLDRVEGADALVSAAAISDYTVDPAPEKLRSGAELTLDLEPTPKLIDRVREAHPDLPIAGFKLESGGEDADLVERAREPLERVGLAFVVANRTDVLGDEETSALIVREEAVDGYQGSKAGLGLRVADELVRALQE